MRPGLRPVLSCTSRPPRARVRLEGELDLATRDHLGDVLACLRVRGCLVVEVDAQEVSFVDASCLRVLHDEAVRVRELGGSLLLVAASTTFVRIVELAGYDDLLPGPPDCVSPPTAGRPSRRTPGRR